MKFMMIRWRVWITFCSWLNNRGIYLTISYSTLLPTHLFLNLHLTILFRILPNLEIKRNCRWWLYSRPSLSRFSIYTSADRLFLIQFLKQTTLKTTGKLIFREVRAPIDDNNCYSWHQWWLTNHQDLWSLTSFYLNYPTYLPLLV